MAEPQDWLKLEIGEADKPVNADAYSAIFASTIAHFPHIWFSFSPNCPAATSQVP
jgi:hypothetical protein